jgi:gamma-glutamyltranspeptidase/glutathione hydrolase
MIDNFSDAQEVRKAVVAGEGGVVAAQHKKAALVGAAVLAAGGDAVDAAVATSFALGAVEPWMSGVAAGGCMVLWRADEKQAHVVDYGMRSPRELDPADYPLSGGPRNSDLFPWAADAVTRPEYQSTSRPSSARPTAGATSSRHGLLPCRACARPMPETTPGTATAVAPRTLRSSTTQRQGNRSELRPSGVSG